MILSKNINLWDGCAFTFVYKLRGGSAETLAGLCKVCLAEILILVHLVTAQIKHWDGEIADEIVWKI
jgi:hypothetical protein